MQQRGAARVREKLSAQADESARRNFEFHADAAGAVIDHFCEFGAAAAESFHDDADEIFRTIDDEKFERLEAAAVFGADDDFGFSDREFVAFAAHGFDEDGELKFAASENAEGVGAVGIFDANGDVGEEFSLEAVANVARSDELAFASSKRRRVDGENHGESWLVDQERIARRGIFEICDGLADLNAFDSGDGDDVSRGDFLRFVAFEAAESVELGDDRGRNIAGKFCDADLGAALHCAVEDTADRNASEKIAVVEIGDLNLERRGGIAGRSGNIRENGFEERLEICGAVAKLAMGDAGFRVGVEDGKTELIFGGVEIDEEIVDFVEDFLGASVGAIDFVEDDDGRKVSLQRFLEDVARLRERAFAGVDEKKYAIDHAEGAFDFSAEVGMAGGIDDIDFVVVVKEGGVFREDGDAALAFEIVGVHDAFGDDLIGAEDAGLAEHGVDECGFAVVDVGDDGDVANGFRHG